MSKTIGIIGGMGPAATNDLYSKIIQNTPAKCDQDHLHVIIDSNPAVPDRTEFVMRMAKYRPEIFSNDNMELKNQLLDNYKGDIKSTKIPLNFLIKSASMLENAGAEILIMPCNTSHFFYNQMVSDLSADLISMVQVSADSIKESKFKKVLILATNGTICGDVYSSVFKNSNIDFEYPSFDDQQYIMSLIYDFIKKGDYEGLKQQKTKLNEMINNYKSKNIDAVVLACTELPIVFEMLECDVLPAIDTTLELAKAAVKAALSTN